MSIKDPRDYVGENHLSAVYPVTVKEDDLTVRIVRNGSERRTTMEVALNARLLSQAGWQVADPEFESLLQRYSKESKIPIEKLNRDHIKRI